MIITVNIVVSNCNYFVNIKNGLLLISMSFYQCRYWKNWSFLLSQHSYRASESRRYGGRLLQHKASSYPEGSHGSKCGEFPD